MDISDLANFIKQQAEAGLPDDLVADLKNDFSETKIAIEETAKCVGEASPEAESICRAVLNAMKTKVACHTLVVEDVNFVEMSGAEEEESE